MINLNDLAQEMQDDLNASPLTSAILEEYFPNVEFRFRIILDTAEYLPPERFGNKVTVYINGVMSIISSETEGINIAKTSYNAMINTSVEFLIPMASDTSNDGAAVLVEAVRMHIGTHLQYGVSGSVNADDMSYLLGEYHTVSNTGTRAIRERVGDSMTLIMYSRYILIAQGVPSSAYQLYIINDDNKEEAVIYSSLSLTRKTATSFALAAEDVQADQTSAKATPLNTVLSIALTAPVRTGYFDRVVSEYLLTGEIKPFNAILKIPNTEAGEIYLKLIIESKGVGAELNKAAAMSVSLAEYQDPTDQEDNDNA